MQFILSNDNLLHYGMSYALLATSTPTKRASSRGRSSRKVQAWDGDDSTPSPVSVSIPYGERNGDRDRDRNGDRSRDWERDKEKDKDKEKIREGSRGSNGIERNRTGRISDRDTADKFNSSIISKYCVRKYENKNKDVRRNATQHCVCVTALHSLSKSSE